MNLLKLRSNLLNFQNDKIRKMSETQIIINTFTKLFSKSLPIVITNEKNPKPMQNMNSSKSQIFVQNL